MARPAEGWTLRKHGQRFYVRFTCEGERVELATGSGDPEEAARRAATIYAEYVSGERARRLKASDPSAPISAVAAYWLADVEHELDPGTVGTMLVYVRHFEAYFCTMGGLTDAACARYGRDRLAHVKRQTVRKELSALRRFLRWCSEQGVLSRSPTLPALSGRSPGTTFSQRRRSRATPIAPEEAEAIIELLPPWSASKTGEPFAVRARFRVAWETALRPGTLDLLSVPENYVAGNRVLVISDEIDKVRFGREVPLTPKARDALDAVLPPVGVIFGGHNYRAQLAKAAAKVLPPERARTFTAYDLRHARATQWAEGGNLVGVAYLLGHKQVTTTNKYARPNQAAAKRVLKLEDSSALTRFRPRMQSPLERVRLAISEAA
jgi:integrase